MSERYAASMIVAVYEQRTSEDWGGETHSGHGWCRVPGRVGLRDGLCKSSNYFSAVLQVDHV